MKVLLMLSSCHILHESLIYPTISCEKVLETFVMKTNLNAIVRKVKQENYKC